MCEILWLLQFFNGGCKPDKLSLHLMNIRLELSDCGSVAWLSLFDGVNTLWGVMIV